MSASSAEPTPEAEKLRSPAEILPPVEAPTATFLLQLFLIPLLIVSVVVLMWLLFSWVAHMGHDNAADLVKSIERGGDWSGQRAFELADLLRSPDPRSDAIRRDAALAKRMADFLERDLADDSSDQNSKPRLMRRMYLCRALGSFHVPDGLPVLITAAQQERDLIEVEVRYSALEAISTLAKNCGSEIVTKNQKALEAILEASRAQDDASESAAPAAEGMERPLYRPHAELRAVAAFALGVIGGEEPRTRLRLMLHDGYPNARYNAATGLARWGDVACEPVLKEMLDPANDAAIRDERYPNDQARKRTTVLLNGIKATLTLAKANPQADLSRLKQSLEQLANSPLENVLIDRYKVKSAALEAIRLIDSKKQANRS
jgi:hypothetical protein